jgi:hypothetical protein
MDTMSFTYLSLALLLIAGLIFGVVYYSEKKETIMKLGGFIGIVGGGIFIYALVKLFGK